MKWMPIDTAPEDGELILVCRFGKEDAPSYNVVYKVPPDIMRPDTLSHPWHFADHASAYHKDWPTHWARLRPPPAVERIRVRSTPRINNHKRNKMQ